MILLKYKDLFVKFIFCSMLLLIIMLVLGKVFYKGRDNSKTSYDSIITSNINYVDDKTSIDVEYPRFNNDKINKLITDSLYSYIKEFRKNEDNKSLNIRYDLYEIDNYVNVQYTISNSLDDVRYNNMLINVEKGELANITSLYDEEYLKNEIYNKVKEKYPNEVYDEIINEKMNNYTFIMKADRLEVFFNTIYTKPNIAIDYVLDNKKNDNAIHKHKYIILTYNDGPSEYTDEILSILEKYDSSATFFMSGNKMKTYRETVENVYNSNSEIGSHGYSHINLENASEDDIDMEISLTNSIYNEITGDTLDLYRSPYNSYNSYMDTMELNIIKNDIDSTDWLMKDTKTIYNNIIRNACDGCSITLRDTYKSSIELTEKLIPELNRLGYEVVSFSKYNNK